MICSNKFRKLNQEFEAKKERNRDIKTGTREIFRFRFLKKKSGFGSVSDFFIIDKLGYGSVTVFSKSETSVTVRFRFA